LAAIKADGWAEYPPFSLSKKGTLALYTTAVKKKKKKKEREKNIVQSTYTSNPVRL